MRRSLRHITPEPARVSRHDKGIGGITEQLARKQRGGNFVNSQPPQSSELPIKAKGDHLVALQSSEYLGLLLFGLFRWLGSGNGHIVVADLEARKTSYCDILAQFADLLHDHLRHRDGLILDEGLLV